MKCSRGYLADSAGLTDVELIEQDKFCDCAIGRSARRLAERRVADWQSWQKQTIDENIQRSKALVTPKRISGSPIPWTLEDASLAALKAKSRLENGEIDPEKRIAIDTAEILMRNGEISSKGADRNSLTINSMMIFGPPGVGKTGCLMPVYLAWQKKGKDCYFVDFKHLMRMVRDGYNPLPGEPTATEVVNRACTAEVLFFDDLGHTWEKEIKAHSIQIAGDIIRYRYSKKLATLMTTNLDPSALANQLMPEIFQRMGEFARVVKMSGKLLRQLN